MSEAAQPAAAAPASPNAASATSGSGDSGVPRAPEVPVSISSFGVTPHPGIEGDKPLGPEDTPAGDQTPSPDPAAPAEPGKDAAAAPAAGAIEVTVRGEKRSYTPQQATHLIQTLVGQYKSREQREHAAAASAKGWHEEAERRQARITELETQLRSGSAPAAGAPSSPAKDGKPAAAADAANGEIDWQLVNEIANHAEGGPMVAMHYVTQEMNRLAEARLNAALAKQKEELTQTWQPILDERSEGAQLRELEQLVTVASKSIDPRNPTQPAYPELSDASAIEGIAQALTELAPIMRPEALMTPFGLHQAVMLYRWRTGGGTGAPPVVAAADPAAPPPTPTDAALAGALSGVEPPAGRPTSPTAAPGDMAAAIRNAAKGDPVFGVVPHRGY